MSRIPYATTIDSELKTKLVKLSIDTRIPQSKLIDEAIEYLLKKYNKEWFNVLCL